MLDLKLIRQDPKVIEKKLQTKIPEIDLSSIISLDSKIRELQTLSEQLKSKLNSISKEIGLKKQKKEDASSLMENVEGLKTEILKLENELNPMEEERTKLISFLPNIPMDDILVSLNPKDNVCVKQIGEKRTFSFPFKNHVELNEKLKLFDFERAVKLTGNRWTLYTNMGARLEWALLNYMLEIHIKNGFVQIIPPLLVNKTIMFGSGQLPKFKDQLFHLKDEDYDLYLIPTSEVAINGMHYDEILEEENLPLKYVSYTPCFRREAGAAGKQERGLIRTHQFNKVELFCFTKPEESPQIFEQMVSSAEEVLQGLELHYRNMLLVTGDMSYASAKTIDIEVWLPGQDRYYEVSSVSNCTDFQARRSSIRYRKKQEKTNFVHTLNGSGVATSRLMVAILENNQLEDGSVIIPKVLRKYLNNQEVLKPV
ncbi:MAG: serine--tRNA ligase [Chlamydiae bacterium]|nr:serine--tRNA ligase [Chlamydiota bacterium]